MTADNRSDWAGRLQRLHRFLETDRGADRLDAFVVSTPVNVSYLTGFTGSTSLLVVSTGVPFLIVDGRYAFAARQALAEGALGPVQIELVDSRYDPTLAALTTRERMSRVAFEAGHVTVATLGVWRRLAGGIEWIATERVVEDMRSIKDAAEIAKLRRAGQALSAVAGELGRIVARGRSEQEVAASIDAAILRHGFERPAFPTIVASGPNSALPHARPTDRRLTDGDLVVLDFGGVLDGYCVDLTRMAAVGPVSAEATLLYEGVRAANVAATRAVRPGIEASDIDRAARDVLEARGLGKAFLHATGHGLGLEVHEAPRIAKPSPDAPERIAQGMVFTIEPGAYVEGTGGVRLEDDVLVTAGGCEVLTQVPHDLLRL